MTRWNTWRARSLLSREKHVERDIARLRPGVDREVRLGEDDGTGDTGGLPCFVLELIEVGAQRAEASVAALADTQVLEGRASRQKLSVRPAAVDVRNQMESVHFPVSWQGEWNGEF